MASNSGKAPARARPRPAAPAKTPQHRSKKQPAAAPARVVATVTGTQKNYKVAAAAGIAEPYFVRQSSMRARAAWAGLQVGDTVEFTVKVCARTPVAVMQPPLTPPVGVTDGAWGGAGELIYIGHVFCQVCAGRGIITDAIQIQPPASTVVSSSDADLVK